MKKFILSIILIISFFFFLPLKADAQTSPNCHEVFNKESNSCLKESTKCIDSCVDKANKVMSLTVDGGKVNLECQRNVCDPASKACDDKAMANFRACQDAKSAQKVSAKVVEKSPLEKLLDTPVFVGEWLDLISAGSAASAFLGLSNDLGSVLLEDPEIAIWEEEQRQKYKKDFEEYIQEHPYLTKDELDRLINRPPTVDEISGYKSGVWEKDSSYRLDYLEGEASIKYPGENEWKELKAGDKIPPGSRIFTGMDTTTMITIKNKGVIQVLPFTEITVNEYGLDKAATVGQTTTDIKIDTGEIEVYTEKQFYEDLVRWRPSLRVQFFNNYAAPRGTHFWVSYDKVKNLSAIGVYKGEVEVKSQGETRLVSPTSDGPGIIVIAQKLSPVKIAIFGLVSVAVVGGAILVLRRKLTLKELSKKKK